MPKTTGIITMSGRTLEEVKAGIRLRMRNMVYNALEIGNDLIEAKEACGHGEWLPFLRDIGLSSSTAANYMRIAREVGADSKMASLPYTKILAVLAAPPEEREELAGAAEEMSAAEIRKLTEERNKAAEAVNAETARADQAEKEAKEYYDEAAHLRTRIQELEVKAEREYQRGRDDTVNRNRELQERIDVLHVERREMEAKLKETERMADQRLEDLKQARELTGEMIKSHSDEISDLKAKLLTAENNRVEVEVVPEDYEKIKSQLAAAEKNAQELIDAAADAEERAAAAEAELEAVRAENVQEGVSEYEKLHFAMKTFLMQCELMATRPERLMRDAERVLRDVRRLRLWCDAISQALDSVQTAEGAVV